jgi:hypothetical protein
MTVASARRSSQPDSVNALRSCIEPQGYGYPQQASLGIGGDLDVQARAAALAGVVVLVTSTIAGRDIGSVDQDEPAADGLFEAWNMQAQRLADQWKNTSIDPRYCRLTDSEQVTHGSLVQILPDVQQSDHDSAIQSHDWGPSLFLTALDDLPKCALRAPQSGQQ